MSGHTPGPWALQLAEECTGRKLDEMVQWIVTANDHDLWISTGPTWDAEHSEESLANARLIAAAPDLFEALIRLMRGTYDLQDALAAAKQAHTAIAKAKGEQP